MAKIKLNVNKLGDPTVNYISLVSRGANRIPFRIVKHDKQESGMIDLASLNLSKLFKGEQKPTEVAAPAPTIVGFVTMMDENFDLVKKHLKDAGYKISNISEEADGSVVFKQQEEMPDHFDVIKMSDALLVLVDGADGENAVEGTIYESLLKEDSFLPSQEIATKGMALAMNEISGADEAIEEKVAKMELVTKDYNGYLAKLFSWVPAQLNVMASLLEKEIGARAGVKPEATVDELRGAIQGSPEKATDTAQNINQESGVEAKGTPSPIALDNAMPKDLDKKVQGVSKEEEVVTTVAKSEAEVLADVTAQLSQKMEALFGNLQASINEQIGGVQEQFTSLNASFENLKKSQDGLHDRVVEAEKVAKSADSVVRGRLVTSDATDDVSMYGVQKAEASEPKFGGCIDTAFQSNVRKTAKPIQRAGR